MPSLLVAHHRPGFYLRVIEEGPVRAGDAIVKVADGPERLTVAQVDGLLYLPNKSRPLLERALRVPALSEGWKGSFRELLAKADGDTPPPPAWTGFRLLRVAQVRRESATITSFRLVATDDAPSTPSVQAGQYLTVRVQPDGDAPPLTRSYSLSDVPGERGYRISVKREGAVSRYLHQHVKAGDLLDAAAPRGSFVLRDGTRPVVLISAGVGATPVLAMLHALAGEGSTRPIWWLHGARNRDEHAFGAEVDALLSALPDGHRLVAYSRPAGDDPPGADHDVVGRLDLAMLERAGVPKDADYYLCGPDGFMRAIGAAITARGVAPERVATEAFWRRPRLRLGDRQGRRPDAARPRRSTRHRPDHHLLPQQPRRGVERRVPQPARPRRSLRRAGGLRLPARRLPQLRKRHSRRRGDLRHRTPRTAARRPGPRLLQPPQLRTHTGPLSARPIRAQRSPNPKQRNHPIVSVSLTTGEEHRATLFTPARRDRGRLES